jgi:hypothetical protein
VTSVIADAPASIAARDASRFSLVITDTVPSMSRSSAIPRFSAVVASPPPTGFVNQSESPTDAVLLRRSREGCTVPVTAIPYFGSGSSIECPPTTATPAAAHTSAPPRRISRSTSPPRSASGKATRFRAVTGTPPIAYTSDSAFAAAIRPKSYGSSTIGVKKSAVDTSASVSDSR